MSFLSINMKKIIFDSTYNYPYAEAMLFMVSAILGIKFIIQNLNSGFVESNRIILLILFIIVLYGILFIKKLKNANYRKYHLLFSIILSLCMASSLLYYDNVFAGNIMGFNDYLNGNTFIDYEFQATISESIAHRGYPSLLCIEPKFLRYHTGVSYLFAILSKATGIPVIMIIHYIYPLLAGPVFLFLILSLIPLMKKELFHCSHNENTLFDVIISSTLLLGCFGLMRFGYSIGLFIPSIILSSTMLFGMNLLLITIYILISYKNALLCNDTNMKLIYFLFIIPMLLFIITISKVSVGCFFLSMICIFIFSNEEHSKFFWNEILLCAFYIIFFYCFVKLLVNGSSSIKGSGKNIIIVPFAFLKRYNFLRNILLVIITWTPLAFFLYSIKWNIMKIFTRKQCIGNILLVGNIAMWIPTLTIDMHGGSAVYFFMVPFVLSIMLCLAKEIPQKIFSFYSQKKQDFIILFFTIFIIIGIANNSLFIFKNFTSDLSFRTKNGFFSRYTIADSDVYQSLINARMFAMKHPNDTICYINETSPFLHQKPKSNVFLLQTFLGLPVINSFYFEDDKLMIYGKSEKQNTCIVVEDELKSGIHSYGLDYWKNKDVKKMSQDDAVLFAKNHNYNYMIIACNNSIHIVDINNLDNIP